MAELHRADLVVGLTGAPKTIRGTRLRGERYIHVELPDAFGDDQIKMMSKDLELISELSQKNSKELIGILNAAQAHQFEEAQKIANDIGFTEENMIKRGGGQVGYAALILGGLVLLAVVMGSHSGESHPEPVGPNPGDADAGAPDAGGGG